MSLRRPLSMMMKYHLCLLLCGCLCVTATSTATSNGVIRGGGGGVAAGAPAGAVAPAGAPAGAVAPVAGAPAVAGSAERGSDLEQADGFLMIVVGSMNADTFLPVERLPSEGENLTLRPGCHPIVDVPGGKGCTQAVASSKLIHDDEDDEDDDDDDHHHHHRGAGNRVIFAGQFGTADMTACLVLRRALEENHVDIDHCRYHPHLSCGRGYVLSTSSGSVSAVISGGSNSEDGWTDWKHSWERRLERRRQQQQQQESADQDGRLREDEAEMKLLKHLDELLVVDIEGEENEEEENEEDRDDEHDDDETMPPNRRRRRRRRQKQKKIRRRRRRRPTYRRCLMLQREVPEFVNLLIASHARERFGRDGILIVQDVGGEDRPISRRMLRLVDYLMPNETELTRLLHSLDHASNDVVDVDHEHDHHDEEEKEEKENKTKDENDDDDDMEEEQEQEQEDKEEDDMGHHQQKLPKTKTTNDDDDDDIDDDVVRAAKRLQERYGARNVLVTQGSRGCTLVTEGGRHVLFQPALDVAITAPPRPEKASPSSPMSSEETSTASSAASSSSSSSSTVVDETGAGDCFRAAFCVALMEKGGDGGNRKDEDDDDDDDENGNGLSSSSLSMLRDCMIFASAAGACAVTRQGAVPGAPNREDVEARIVKYHQHRQMEKTTRARRHDDDDADDGNNNNNHAASVVSDIPRGGGGGDGGDGDGNDDDDKIDGSKEKEQREDDKEEMTAMQNQGAPPNNDDEPFPFLFGSRLNSMKDRPDLWRDDDHDDDDPHRDKQWTPRELVRRQSRIRGLTCVDFNYPQHFGGHWTAEEARTALRDAGLVPGAVCLRYPSPRFDRGAMNHPVPSERRRAVDLTKEAADVARLLGCREVVVWSAFDGYDYPFQVDYRRKWTELVEAFRECCDARPDMKFSLEYKPTDEHTRFFTVPSTAAAILLVREVDRPNMGLTLDVGHMLMSGENPAQSIAMVGQLLSPRKLFGVQLNDGYTRLAAEDGLVFGSVHPAMALEVMHQLRRIGFDGHLYFDTFPQRTDPVAEAECNIRRARMFWDAVRTMDPARLARVARDHDALGALAIVDDALQQRRRQQQQQQ